MRPKSYTDQSKRCFTCRHCRDVLTCYGYALLCIRGEKFSNLLTEDKFENNYKEYIQSRTVDPGGYCPKYEDTTL